MCRYGLCLQSVNQLLEMTCDIVFISYKVFFILVLLLYIKLCVILFKNISSMRTQDVDWKNCRRQRMIDMVIERETERDRES